MRYLEFCEALGLTPVDSVRKIYEEAEDLLQPPDITWVSRLMPQAGEEVLEGAREIAGDPLKLRYVNLLKLCYWVLPEEEQPFLEPEPGNVMKNVGPLLVLLSFVDRAEQEMCRRGIPEDIRSRVHKVYEGVFLSTKRIFGYPAVRFAHYTWVKHNLTPDLFAFGSLEFEMCSFPREGTFFRNKNTGALVGFWEEDETPEAYVCREILRGGALGEPRSLSKTDYECFLRPGEDTLSVHIPGGARVDRAACEAAFAEAREFFARHFPERKPKCFYCRSWLMDPSLADHLAEKSNIVFFQRQFQRCPVKSSGKEVFFFVHPKPFERYEELPENTSLERMLKTRYLAGDPVYAYAGLCPFEDQ